MSPIQNFIVGTILGVYYATYFCPLCVAWLQDRTKATMQTRFRSVLSAEAEGEDAPSPFDVSASKLVKVITKVMICELQGEEHSELALVGKDETELRTNTTKVLGHISFRLNGIGNIMSFAVVSNETSKLRADANDILEKRNALSNEKDLWLSKVGDWLAIVEQDPVSAFTPELRA